jgi:hypothetical protein
MTFALLTGILAAFLLSTVAFAMKRAPTRLRCPECGHPTDAIQGPEWLRRGLPSVRFRWCSACGWEGVGREGPHWVPGQRIAHDSGFHWGDERTPPDFGFRFARPPEQTMADTPPDHPSGFRFGDDGRDLQGDDPPGFSWSRRTGRGPFTGDGAPGFNWAEGQTKRGPDRRSGVDRRSSTDTRSRQGRRWFGRRDVG